MSRVGDVSNIPSGYMMHSAMSGDYIGFQIDESIYVDDELPHMSDVVIGTVYDQIWKQIYDKTMEVFK